MPEIRNFNDCFNEQQSNSILLGNGFSISIYNRFSYATLYQEAIRNAFLTTVEELLFNDFRTQNFEEILNLLSIARQVNQNLNIDDQNVITDHYDRIKNALINTIHFIHPSFSNIDIGLIRSLGISLFRFKNIYTTNYDIILYWIILNQNDTSSRFVDLFFNEQCSFNMLYKLRSGQIPVLYLHGALHITTIKNLFENYEHELTVKLLCRNSHDLLRAIEDCISSGGIPLFVSEGNYKTKMSEIKKNDYLFHCYNHLYNLNSNLFIFGHSLSDADKHIAEAINKSNTIRNVYFGIYLPAFQDQLSLDNEMMRIRSLLNRKTIEFYDSATF